MLYQVRAHVTATTPSQEFFLPRRDKEFCHHCRYCCTLSICTNQHGSYFRQSTNRNITGSENKVRDL